ncbi:MAG: hypothetical protein JWN06_3480 [Propionibacteriaceae bacterium]|nr:hypothetical protein [Propionibacteriaceae bacterium]
MEFGVVHEITDPEAWQEACDADPQEPPDFHLNVWVGAVDQSRALCVWQAPGAEALQAWLDDTFGHAAVNLVFPANVNILEPLGPS